MKLSGKSVIPELQFKICQLICRINDLACRQIDGWEMGADFKIFSGNYEINGCPDNPITIEVPVFISPTNWPGDSGISVQFFWDRSSGWQPTRGNVILSHLDSGGFSFRCKTSGGCLYIFPEGGSGRKISPTMESIIIAIEGKPIIA